MGTRFEDLLDTMSLSLDTQSTGRMVVELPLERIASDPNNPRQSFSDAELAEMAESIKAHGVLQPIVVRQVEGEQRYIIRFGDRRFRASALAGKETIPAIVAETGEEADDLVQQVVENDQHVDLTAGELARAVAKLVKAGMKQADIAKRFGRPKPMISMYAAVASMPPMIGELANRLDDDELAQLDAAAAERGVKRTDWIAAVVRSRLRAAPPPHDARQTLVDIRRELRAIGRNVNQAIHALHAANMQDSRLDVAREAARVEAMRATVEEQIAAIGAALHGDLAYWRAEP